VPPLVGDVNDSGRVSGHHDVRPEIPTGPCAASFAGCVPRVMAHPAKVGKGRERIRSGSAFGRHLSPKTAAGPSSSSMRRSWLYLATRSDREALPVLICPAFVATAMSAIVASSVSPERWLITAV